LKFKRIKSNHVQGILEPESSRKYPFQRLPQKYKNKVRQEVWDLSENSAGVSMSFFTNTSTLVAKWKLKNKFKMHHMTDVAISGLDLYQKRNKCWDFTGAAIPEDLENEVCLFSGLKKKLRHFRIHLPLYNTLISLELGIDADAQLKINYKESDPLIFYGTSITQGGCASRPGLAYTNIISRKLNKTCINLGFSGNGHLEVPIAKILSKINSAFFIIDCMWNIDENIITKNTRPFLSALRSKKENSQTPIIFYEKYVSDINHPDKKQIHSILQENLALKKEINKKIKNGFKKLYVFSQDGCLREDSEFTVDGVHFNDLGFERFAKHFLKNLKKLV